MNAPTYLSRQYHQAAARLAVDHAERRLQQSLAAFVESLDAPADGYSPIAESLSTRLALLRRSVLPAAEPTAADQIRSADRAEVRRAA